MINGKPFEPLRSCDVCVITCPSHEHLLQHLLSAKHLARVEAEYTALTGGYSSSDVAYGNMRSKRIWVCPGKSLEARKTCRQSKGEPSTISCSCE